jgi:hypothetical protein
MKRVRKSRDDPIIRHRKRTQTNPSKRSGASAPDLSRVLQRQDPESWGLDDLLTLPEAALLCPPLTVTTLRTSVRKGQLPVAVIAGKFFTTRRHLAVMTDCRPLDGSRPGRPRRDGERGKTLTAKEARQLLDSELSLLRYPRNPQG